MRSSLTTVNTCWSIGRADSADSDTFIGPTPSAARPEFTDWSQSELLGAMLAEGFDGGRIPAAPAGALVSAVAADAMQSTANGAIECSKRITGTAIHLVFPLLISRPPTVCRKLRENLNGPY